MILKETLPQLIFFDELNYPPGIPGNVRSYLFLLFGKELPIIEKACGTFNDCLILISKVVDALITATNMDESPTDRLIYQKDKSSSTRTVKLFSFSTQRSSFHIYSRLYGTEHSLTVAIHTLQSSFC